jgi:steroid delta-isomerase-like uncharacterized protein
MPITNPKHMETLQKLGDCFATKDWKKLRTLFADDFVDHNLGWKVKTADDLIERVSDMVDKLDIKEEVQDVIEAGDKIVLRVHSSGVHRKEAFGFPPTGKKVEWDSVEIWRLDSEGKIAEIWFYSDLLELFYQLGLELPEKHKNL